MASEIAEETKHRTLARAFTNAVKIGDSDRVWDALPDLGRFIREVEKSQNPNQIAAEMRALFFVLKDTKLPNSDVVVEKLLTKFVTLMDRYIEYSSVTRAKAKHSNGSDLELQRLAAREKLTLKLLEAGYKQNSWFHERVLKFFVDAARRRITEVSTEEHLASFDRKCAAIIKAKTPNVWSSFFSKG